MILSPHDSNRDGDRLPAKDPMQLATFPLAVQLALDGLSDVGVINLISH